MGCHPVAAVQYTFIHKQYTEQQKHFWKIAGRAPVFAIYTLAFFVKLKKRHGKTSVRVAEECQLAR